MPKAKKAPAKKKATKKTDKADKRTTKKGKKKMSGKEKKTLATKNEILKKHKAFKKEIGSKLIPNSKLRAYYKNLGIRASNDLVEGLADEVYTLLKKSALRAVKNGRKTVRTWDY